MNDRRAIHSSRVGLHDRRICWFERRQHRGPFRFVFIDVRDLAFRLTSIF